MCILVGFGFYVKFQFLDRSMDIRQICLLGMFDYVLFVFFKSIFGESLSLFN